jgi:hypothetical protein
MDGLMALVRFLIIMDQIRILALERAKKVDITASHVAQDL